MTTDLISDKVCKRNTTLSSLLKQWLIPLNTTKEYINIQILIAVVNGSILYYLWVFGISSYIISSSIWWPYKCLILIGLIFILFPLNKFVFIPFMINTESKYLDIITFTIVYISIYIYFVKKTTYFQNIPDISDKNFYLHIIILLYLINVTLSIFIINADKDTSFLDIWRGIWKNYYGLTAYNFIVILFMFYLLYSIFV